MLIDPAHAAAYRSGGSGEVLGRAMAWSRDLDGDGDFDVLLGAPGTRNQGFAVGAVRVVSGRDGQLVRTLMGLAPGSEFGAALLVIDDVDADGYPDFCVGAPGAGPGMVSLHSDVLCTDTGHENLTRAVPKERVALEALVGSAGA